MSRLGSDGIAAVVLIVLGILGFLEVRTYPEQAGVWPKWMLGALIALAVVLLVQSVLRGRRAP
ncbi:MAG: hypothetical protein ACK4QW_08770 [Alphaproteobacteria bacterium]